MPKYPFSAIVENIKDKRMPVPEDQYSYIGLEHLDSGRFAVSRQGSPSALKGSKLIMKQGDILFGKRNAYLRRVAIAPHDGLFSAHGMIFRPKKAIDPSFAPFFLRSDNFMQTAIDISVGSISPTVNWSDLKDLEFYLPPLSKQKELAKVLWTIEEAVEKYESLLSKCDELVKSRFVEMFSERFLHENVPLLQKCKAMIGLTYSPDDIDERGTIVLRSGNIQNGSLQIKEDLVKVKSSVVSEKKLLKPMDVLMCARNGSADLVGKNCIIPYDETQLSFGTFMTAFRTSFPRVLKGFFDSTMFREQIANSKTSSVNQITNTMLSRIHVFDISSEDEERFGCFYSKIDKLKFVNRINSRFLRNGMLCRRHRCL